jgi:multisubunit Na+/H+ antiporter MnhG subunit
MYNTLLNTIASLLSSYNRPNTLHSLICNSKSSVAGLIIVCLAYYFIIVHLFETKKHNRFKLVYLLLKLVCILPVATASVERVFSAMNYVKAKLRNKIGDQYLNDYSIHSKL